MSAEPRSQIKNKFQECSCLYIIESTNFSDTKSALLVNNSMFTKILVLNCFNKEG